MSEDFSFTIEDSEVCTLTLSLISEERDIIIIEATFPNTIIITIEDSGEGISEEVINLIKETIHHICFLLAITNQIRGTYFYIFR